MNIKCAACGTINTEFAGECRVCHAFLGANVPNIPVATTPVTPVLQSELETYPKPKIEELLFVPKKKSRMGCFKFVLLAILGVIGLVVTGFIGLVIYFMANPEATSQSLEDLKENQTQVKSINNLEIANLDSEWVGRTFYIKGTLKNNNLDLIKNVLLRIDFSTDKEKANLFDSRTFYVNEVQGSGAFSFNEPVAINPPEGDFWYWVYPISMGN